jgi:O-antigen/teichoic acid export membrane protein
VAARNSNGPTRASLSSGLSFGALSFLSTAAVGLITSVFIARLYGVRVVGQFALVLAPVGAVWLLSTVREQPALVREAAILPPRSPRVTGLFLAVFAFSTALTMVVSAIGVIVVYFIFHGPIRHPELFLPAVASLAAYTLFTNTCVNFDSIFAAFRDGRGLFWLRLHQALLYLVLIVGGRIISRSVWVLVVATAASWLFPCIHRVVRVRKWMKLIVPAAEMKAGFAALPEMLRFGLKLTPGGLLWGASDQIGTWVLGSVSSIAAVGAFNRAWLLSQRFSEAPLRLSELLFPTLVERHGNNDRVGFDRALMDSLRYATVFLLLFAAVGGGSANAIMSVFGPGFTRASMALEFLLLVPAALTMVTVLSQALIASDRPLATSVAAAVRMITTVPCVVILTQQLGITGAALGMLLGALAQLAFQLGFAQREVIRLLSALWPARQMLGQVVAYSAGFVSARATISLLPGYVGLSAAIAVGSAAYLSAIVIIGGLLPRDRQRLSVARGRLGPALLPPRHRAARQPGRHGPPPMTRPESSRNA